jgi:hypothetical protein
MTLPSVSGKTWVFEQTSRSGDGFWYHVAAGRIDEEGRGLGKVPKVTFRNFTGDILICPPGLEPPGTHSPEEFPILRYADRLKDEGHTPLGVMWGFCQTHKSGKGYPDKIGISWFDEQGRAHARFLLRISVGFRGIVIACPRGIEPPYGPFAPIIVVSQQGAKEEEEEAEVDADI